MNTNLSFYHVFNTVAASSSISKAAEKLYISQPAVSKSIQQLESNLGTQLFIRSSKGVKLTKAGILLYEHSKSALDSLYKGEEILKSKLNLGVDHLYIGVSITLCKHMLLPYLRSFTSKFPHTKITIKSQSSSDTIRSLENKGLDLGLIAKPKNHKHLEYLPLSQIQDIFVARKSYLENLKLRVATENFLSHGNLMLLDEDNVSRKYIDVYLKENMIESRNILEVSNMDLLIDFAKTGIGIACVIKEFVQDELAIGDLIEIPLDIPIEKREVGFAFLKSKDFPKPISKFLKHLKLI